MNKKNNNKCGCGCSKKELVLTVTQLDGQTILEPENLENRDKILVLSKNINNAYNVKVMSTLTVRDLAKAIQDTNVAFLLAEMQEPAAPAAPEEPEKPDNGDSTETTEPEDPDTEGTTDDDPI